MHLDERVIGFLMSSSSRSTLNLRGILPYCVAVGVVALHGCAPIPAQGQDHDSIKRILASITEPAAPQDLFRNIRWAIENNVMLREEFYTESSIKKMFGADSVEWTENVAGKYRSAIAKRRAGSLQTATRDQSCLDSAVTIWLTKVGVGPTPKTKIQFSIALAYAEPKCSVLSVDLVRNALGEPAKVESFYPPGRPPNIHRQIVPQRTTHPLGNSDVEYVLGNSVISKQMGLEVLGSGVIRSIWVRMEEL